MQLQTEIFGSVVVVHSPEDLSSEQVDGFEAFMNNLERGHVVLDMDNTEAIDSAGLTSIVNVQELLRQQQGDMKIATSNEMNRKILEITRLDYQLEVFDTVLEAVRSFQ